MPEPQPTFCCFIPHGKSTIVASMRFLTFEKGSLTLNTGTLPRRLIVSVIILAVITPGIYRGYRIFRADRIIRDEQTVESYSRAIRYDPSNAILWWHRGRLRHYSIDSADIPGAINDYQKALSMNPRLSQAWVDLADCYERTDRFSEAEGALDNAIATHTYSPGVRWQAGNYYLRRGNLSKMYECFKLACQYDPEKLNIAIALAWKADPNHSDILQKLIPDNLPANIAFLNFLVQRDELDLSRPAWQRILNNEKPAGYEYRVSAAFPYIDQLLEKNLVDEAMRVWQGALQKAEKEPQSESAPQDSVAPISAGSESLVWNGSFEREILGGGFDWRYTDVKEVELQPDLGERMDGLKSLRMDFTGANLSFSHLSQIVPIPKSGDYLLEFYLRTEGLTTDMTPFFAIQGYPDRAERG